MKTALLSCLVATAASKGGRIATCVSSGDPHYTPFSGKKAEKYTIMGEGELCLAKSADSSFHASTCSYDVSVGRKSTKKLTWNRDFQITDSGVTVMVNGGDSRDYTLTVSGAGHAISHKLGVHAQAGTWDCDTSLKGKVCRNIVKDGNVEVKLMRKNRKAKKASSVVVKFPKTNRMLTASVFTKTSKKSKFGTRTLFNIVTKIPKKEAADISGLCGETKTTMRGTAAIEALKTNHIPGCNPVDPGTLVGEGTEELVEKEVKTAPCDTATVSAAVQACADVSSDARMGCILDKIEGCDADGVEDLLQVEADKAVYTCPVNSYISATTWPLVSFEDCTCMWGHTRDDGEETCTPKAAPIAAPVNAGACFCDGTSPFHCMQNSDRSCGLPVLKSDSSKKCDDPEMAMTDACQCHTGTTDCTGNKYHLHIATQPNMAVPKKPFGQQPVIKLVDAHGNLIKESNAKVRISIANAQDDQCKCAEEAPCLHNNIGDNTCHAKYELFGEQVCPAGTTECLPKQSTTKLYQSNPEENPLNPSSLEAKTTQCRMSSGMQAQAGTGFCSGMTPCKHQNDGSCVQKTAFYTQKIEPSAADETARKQRKCQGTTDWRLATPSPVKGWFFSTDSTCSMDKATLGCSNADHSYAMDKWCDVNCNPKFPGQPAFCPVSHCTCEVKQPGPKTPETPDWRCPADRYDDGSCRCAPGTEFCGSIEVDLVNGVAQCQHLTIGTEGKYQLLAEVVMPDQNTGSNNIQILGKTASFDVVVPKTKGTTCRAQAAWRKPAMYDSKAHGEGKAWFFEDSKKCLSRKADGSCESVATEPEYAMDTWCKANACAEHTLESHCEFFTPETGSAAAACVSNKFDMFGDCCHADNVDACGVCGGDGSTCKVVSYLSEPVAISGASEIIFNASLAHDSCDMKNPCMHLNDFTCGPKTVNSKELTGDEHHCFWDRKATADEQPNWKYGTWDVEGRLSRSIETQLEDGNEDCYCPAGTVDISKKIEIEEKAKEDFVATLVEQVERAKNEATDGTIPHEDVVIRNSNSAVVYNAADCKGNTVKLSSMYSNVLCSTHWTETNGKGKCSKGPTCANDQVRSIMLPPMTTAKLYKHCSPTSASAPTQIRYNSIENFGTTAKCFAIPNTDVSNIEIEGDVLKLTTKIVGTTADCFESQCFNYVQKCNADATCSGVLRDAEQGVMFGEHFISALKESIAEKNTALEALVTCAGLNLDKCAPELATHPFSTTLTELKNKAPTTVEVVPTTSSPTSAPTEAATAVPTNAPTAKPTAAPTEAATAGATFPPTHAPTAEPTAEPTAQPTAQPTAVPTTPVPEEVINPTRFNNPTFITRNTFAEPARVLCSCTSLPIQPVVTYRNFESAWRRRLLAGAGTTTAMVQVSSSGNQGFLGSATASGAASAQFATAAGSASSTTTPTTAAASAGGMSSAATALVAVGCVGLVGAMAAVAYKRANAEAAAPVANSKAVTQTAAEDQTDVL